MEVVIQKGRFIEIPEYIMRKLGTSMKLSSIPAGGFSGLLTAS